KSDYEKNKQCLRVKKEVSYKYHIKENWLKKHIGFKNYKKVISYEPHYKFSVVACLDSCFKRPVKFYIPQYDAVGLEVGARYSQKKNNKNGKATLIFSKTKIGDSAYYKAEVECLGTLNCGTDNRCTHIIKLVAKNNISILSYSYYARSHTSYFDSLIEVRPSNNKKITDIYTHMCFYRLNILCNGDTISLKDIPVDVFAHSWKKIKTPVLGEDGISYFMFIPFRKKYWCGHYKKYKIRQKDIENLRHFNLLELPN
ncbi:MAG: hypothetical protein NTZ59_09925, partial [Bacteroidetes bacterium]|nr:hypothetical protein [Bacteroidota bacterium]